MLKSEDKEEMNTCKHTRISYAAEMQKETVKMQIPKSLLHHY